MRKIIAISCSLALTLATMLNPSSAPAAPQAGISVFPIDSTQFVSCVNNGEGELIHFTGELRVLRVAIFTDNTRFTKIQGVANLTGVGETTGVIYRALRISRESLFGNSVGVQHHSLFLSGRVIGRGPGDSFMSHLVINMIFIPNGDMEITVGNFFNECR